MKVYFFGVINSANKGHFLYDAGGRAIYSRESELLPFRYTILDGGLLPQSGPQTQGKLYRSVINGWTVLTMWDRTADSRGNSNASFIAEGEHNCEQMQSIAAKHFPQLWKRIRLPRQTASS